MKKFLKILLAVLLIVILVAAAFLIWLSVSEYKPEPVEPARIQNGLEEKQISLGKEINVLSWNIGYGGLGKGADCFMDGGKDVNPDSKETVEKYLTGIGDYINEENPDLLMLQETDYSSARSFDINETALFDRGNNAYAPNFLCEFVPYPLPPIGRVDSGLFTTTEYQIDEANRIALPCPFTWPVRTANLKRCLLASYLPIENSDKKLVLVNLHLEAYDDGEGKIAQTKMLREFIEKEYKKGNYVIAGGDFNQTFPGSMETYPIVHKDYWVPGVLENSFLPEGWEFTYDVTNPTCRLLNHPYYEKDKEHTQHYVLDGFILSPNVQINSVESVNLHFENSDHNPVKINVTLK